MQHGTVGIAHAAKPASCQACFTKLERDVRHTYERLIREVTSEGMLMGWPREEVVKAREDLKKAEGKEVGVLRGLFGFEFS